MPALKRLQKIYTAASAERIATGKQKFALVLKNYKAELLALQKSLTKANRLAVLTVTVPTAKAMRRCK